MKPIPILLYHQFREDGDSLSTRPEVFEQQLSWLANHEFRSLTLDEFEHRVTGPGKRWQKKEVLITFDDGYSELASVAAPALRRYGFTGVGFLITSQCLPAIAPGDAGDQGANHISWQEARTLASEGVMEFQSHTHSHKRWATDQDGTRELERDLATSLDVLTAELRQPRREFRHLAWPWGICNEDWERMGTRLGFHFQHIVQRGAVTQPGLTRRLPRVCLDGASVQKFSSWLTLLSFSGGASLCNKLFGTIRAHRQGLGYA